MAGEAPWSRVLPTGLVQVACGLHGGYRIPFGGRVELLDGQGAVLGGPCEAGVSNFQLVLRHGVAVPALEEIKAAFLPSLQGLSSRCAEPVSRCAVSQLHPRCGRLELHDVLHV